MGDQNLTKGEVPTMATAKKGGAKKAAPKKGGAKKAAAKKGGKKGR
jgi:hypothetical protein